jgi:ABC-type sugar transport system ATPase subunit
MTTHSHAEDTVMTIIGSQRETIAVRAEPATVVLRLDEVTKLYGAFTALDAVSMDLHAGEIVALCGHNGAGKSTLVRILTGAEQPDSGRLLIGGEASSFRTPRQAQIAGITVVDQELAVVPVLTVEENLALGSTSEPFFNRRRSSHWREVLNEVGLNDVDPSCPLSRLSIAERQLVEIARALAGQRTTRTGSTGTAGRADVLILDEPTATLSEPEIERVLRAVRGIAASGCAVVFVSHRLGEVLALCSRAVVMRDGKLVADEPTTGLTKDRLIALMLGEIPEPPQRTSTPATGGAEIQLANIDVPGKLTDFTLRVRAGEICALAGQVGSGASTVLRAVAGLEPSASGEVLIGPKRALLGSPRRAAAAGIAYLSNDRKSEGLFLEQSIARNLVATRIEDLATAGTLRPSVLRRAAQRLAHTVGIKRNRLRHNVGVLSGGNQQKVFIGRALDRTDVAVLLLDEPTRGVDIGGRADIHRLLREAAAGGLAVIFASTELDELHDLADTVVTMRAGHLVRHYQTRPNAEQILSDMTHESEPAEETAP